MLVSTVQLLHGFQRMYSFVFEVKNICIICNSIYLFFFGFTDATVSLIVRSERTRRDATTCPFPVQRICLDVRMRCATSTFRGFATVWPTVPTVPMNSQHFAQLHHSRLHADQSSTILIFISARLTSLSVLAANAFPWIWCAMVNANVQMAPMKDLVAVSRILSFSRTVPKFFLFF